MIKVEQKIWQKDSGWQLKTSALSQTPQLVLIFGSREALDEPKRFEEVKKMYPNALLLFASTAGEIINTAVYDNSIVATAFHFEKTPLKAAKIAWKDYRSIREAGRALAKQLPKENLKHVFVLSDGHNVNGSELVSGITEELGPSIKLTGGLAGDSARFQKTLVGLDELPTIGRIALLGFYGNAIKIGFGSMGGWDAFGTERIITKSKDNILYELDGQSALALYKKYLGDLSSGLPSTALLFPLSIRLDKHSPPVTRTILQVNETDQSLIFAGDVPEGAYAQLMKANFERLIDGAESAALASYHMLKGTKPDVAILISCVGRRLVLDQRIEEELESVRDILGKTTPLCGFYSYGEIAPTASHDTCQLHNQTMTISTLSE